ncbi:MAG: hypothetical protein JXB32_08075 [Deltaproteobacteria bacterium]|nr:hypothetical protein [Deltaproteobacteria bacterium]
MRRALWCGACLAVGCFQSFSDDDAGGGPEGGRDDAWTDGGPEGGRDDAWTDGGPDGSDDPSVVLDLEQGGAPPVDIIVLVDNSGSMSSEQAALTARFPELLAELMDPPIDPSTGRPAHPPVEDLNLAVISPDMGTAGFTLATCSRPFGGDNGCFRNVPSLPGCASAYPVFLSRNPDNADLYPVDQLAQDFNCIATLGTRGCGFEQPLAAMRAAVTTNAVPGGCNAGFLRAESILVLIFVSDEDDCSVRPEHPEMFDPDRTDLGHINIRCFAHAEFVTPVEDYVAALRALRPDPDRLTLGFIVGVPPDAPQCIGPGDSLDGCLSIPEMIEQIDPATPSQLVPSCNTSMGLAMPPRRFVQLARAFGPQANVDSICKGDWRGCFPPITGRLVEPFEQACLTRPLEFEPGSCRVDCAMVETLSDARACLEDPACPSSGCPAATEAQAFAPPTCTNPATGAACRPLKRDLGTTVGSDGRPRRLCLLRQAERPPAGGSCGAPTLAGWFYVPAAESEAGCPTAFFAGGAEIYVEARSRAVLRCR